MKILNEEWLNLVAGGNDDAGDAGDTVELVDGDDDSPAEAE